MQFPFFKLVKDVLGVREVPVEEELVDDGEVLSGIREAQEDILDISLGLLFDQAVSLVKNPIWPSATAAGRRGTGAD